MIFQQIRQVTVRQAVVTAVARGTAVGPAAIQTARLRNSPESAARIVHHIRNDARVGVPAKDGDVNRPQRSATIRELQAVEPVVCTDPDRAVPALTKLGDNSGVAVAVVRDDGEHRRGRVVGRKVWAATGPAFRVEPHQPARGGDPVVAPARFQKIVDLRIRKTLLGAEIREGVAVKARQSAARAEPEKTARISDNAVDVVVGQPVGGRVDLDRQPFGSQVEARGA